MDSSDPVTIHELGESALQVTLGNGVSPTLNDRALALADHLRQLDIAGVLDIVATYANLLVTFDDTITDEDTVTERVRLGIEAAPPQLRPATKRHVIPVSYGGESGPDLESLAHFLGLTTAEVMRRHAAPIYRVHFLGFMPGFAYLGGLDPSLAAPRLASPRVRVPAGAVGIAGSQTGIYPLASPGGWRLIGRSATTLWDVARDPPALLAPRDEVQFVPSGQQTFGPPAGATLPTHESESSPVFAVQEPGALSMVEDLGRPGCAHFGVSAGGAMDVDALRLANSLVGNVPSAACLEITWSGPTLTALMTTVIAVVGADLGCRVDGVRVPNQVSWLVRAGSKVRFLLPANKTAGARCYLAVAGGISVPAVLGSRSTYLPGGFGGFGGRQLQPGDTLFARRNLASPAELAGRVADVTNSAPGGTATLRYVAYSGPESVSDELRRRVDSLLFEVSPASDRMGVRLLPEKDDALAWRGGELASFGVVRGAIQLPPGGTPVVLGADHQTTGGYPLIGVLARADWPLAAQLRPGQEVRLQRVTLSEARTARAWARG